MNNKEVKELSRAFKNIAYMMQIGGHAVKIVIDADTYDQLADYSKKMDEPMSMIATKAIKKYIDVE
ncbi:hypothetical protein EFR91_02985 [Lactobacillus amylovorus]|nr:hypothetical protein [Lactobacillus amylovorus]